MDTIWLAGAEGSGRRTLLRTLFPDPSTQTGGQTSRLVRLDTKYYTADVAVHVVDLTGAHSEVQCLDAAIVLVVNGTSESSLQAACSWASKQDTTAAGVCLMAVTHADLALKPAQPPLDQGAAEVCRNDTHQAAMDWCSENGFEYVDVCPVDARLDAMLRLDGDSQGLARLMEALQAHAWPGLMRKPLPTLAPGISLPLLGSTAPACGKHTISSAEPAAAARVDDSPISAVQGPMSQSSAAQAHDMHGSSSAECQPPTEAHATAVAVTTASAAGAGATSSTTCCQSAMQQDSAAEEQQMDKLEQLMAEMAEAKGRLASLPDAERRQQAAALAMRMAALLGDDSDSHASDSDA